MNTNEIPGVLLRENNVIFTYEKFIVAMVT